MTILHHVDAAIASLPFEHEAGTPGHQCRRDMAKVREFLRTCAVVLRRQSTEKGD